MDQKDDDRKSAVPLGTFRTSSIPGEAPLQPSKAKTAPPPPPAAALGLRDDDTVQTRAVRNSRASLPPELEGEPERKRVRTLMGVVSPSMSPAPKGTYPAPPKWKKPSERDDEPTVREATMAVPVARIELKPISGRPAPAPAPPSPTDPNISDQIQQMLDEQTSVTMEIEDAPPMPPMPPPPPPPSAASGSRRSSNPPVMLPAHIAAAAQAESANVEEQVAARASLAPEPPLRVSAEPRVRSLSVSSLAPAEVKRRPRRDDSAPALGFAVVTAMAAVFVIGWFATAGGYKPPAHPEVAKKAAAASATATAATPPSAVAAVAPAAEKPTPAVAAPAVAPVAVSPAQAPKPAVQAPAAAPAAAAPAPKSAPAARVVRAVPVPAPAPAPARAPRAARNDVVKITKVNEGQAESAPVEQTASAQPAPVEEDLPDAPRREDVLERLEALRPVVSACAEGNKGVAELDITIAGTGVITTVLVGGDFAGTPQGSCIARSVRQARFPKFKKERFRLLYPFSI